jgi:FMN-dependent NADH-azoreductase
MHNPDFTILRIDGSARYSDSISRRLAAELTERLLAQHPGGQVLDRDLAPGLPVLSEDWVTANFTAAAARTAAQRAELALSDTLVEELRAADVIVMSVPMYNFSVPAAVKAWVDLVARAGLTFRYTANGPEGLLADRPVWLVMATGGVPLGSAVDFASGYLRHFFAFLGIRDVRVIAADGLNRDAAATLAEARRQIAAALAEATAA